VGQGEVDWPDAEVKNNSIYIKFRLMLYPGDETFYAEGGLGFKEILRLAAQTRGTGEKRLPKNRESRCPYGGLSRMALKWV